MCASSIDTHVKGGAVDFAKPKPSTPPSNGNAKAPPAAHAKNAQPPFAKPSAGGGGGTYTPPAPPYIMPQRPSKILATAKDLNRVYCENTDELNVQVALAQLLAVGNFAVAGEISRSATGIDMAGAGWLIALIAYLISLLTGEPLFSYDNVDWDLGIIPGYTPEQITEIMRLASKDVGPTDTLPNDGSVDGGVVGAPPVNADLQGRHVVGHPSNTPDKTIWPPGENGVEITQQGWLNGTQTDRNTRVWDAGRVIGSNGETGVRVHIDESGMIHGYPVNARRYLRGGNGGNSSSEGGNGFSGGGGSSGVR